MKNDKRNKECLLDIMDFIRKIDNVKYSAKTELGLSDEIIVDLLCFELQQIGGSCNKISDEIKSKYSNVEWSKIRGLRNVIAHEYDNVNYRQIENTITKDIPALKEQLIEILKKEFQLDIEKKSNRIKINKTEQGKGFER